MKHAEAKRFQFPIQVGREDRIAVMNKEFAGVVTGKSFPKLLYSPGLSRMRSHSAMQDPPGSHFHDEEHKEDTKSGCHGNKEVAGNNRSRVIADERLPMLR
jgi:hypothetical protein